MWSMVKPHKKAYPHVHVTFVSIPSTILICCAKGRQDPGGGVLKFGLGMDMPPRKLKVDLYKYQFFKKK